MNTIFQKSRTLGEHQRAFINKMDAIEKASRNFRIRLVLGLIIGYSAIWGTDYLHKAGLLNKTAFWGLESAYSVLLIICGTLITYLQLRAEKRAGK